MTKTRMAVVLAAGFALMLSVLMVSPSSAEAQPGSGIIFGTDTACIESDQVQNDPAAASMGVGNVYEGTDGSRHIIVTGPTDCSFNCGMGFDINCDGVYGDHCAAGLNLNRVSDVGVCLAAMAAAEADSVPAIPVEAAGTGGGDALAHTGSETKVIAYLGTGLLSFGALALGARRKLRD